MAVLALVVDGRPALNHFHQRLRVEHLALAGGAPDLFGQRQHSPTVAIGHAEQAQPRLGLERQRFSGFGFRALEQVFEALLVVRLEGQHPGARQKRGVEFERRVFRRRADQHDGAVLHHRQETVLLGAVEPVDLVDEQQRLAAAHAPGARRLEHFLEIGDTGKDRRDLVEGQFGLAGQQPRNGGLAGARRSPKDHRAETAGSDHAGDDAIRTGQMRLAGDFGQGRGPQPVGKRAMPARYGTGSGEEIAHGLTV